MGISWLRARLLFLPTFAWNALLGRFLRLRRWWDEVDPQLIVGALPFARDVPELVRLGVTGVVNTCEEYGGPVAAYGQLGVEQLRIPTVDFTHPRLEDIEEAVAFIDRQVRRGGRVYVHCKAGRGRSATVAACWLIARRGCTPAGAQARLLQARGHVHPRIYLRPVVVEFYRRFGGVEPRGVSGVSPAGS